MAFSNIYCRISYIVYALEEIRKRPDNSSVIMLYDVACSLVRHLQNKRYFDLLSFYKFAIPVFHSYGHKVNCQVEYNRSKD
jgi:hypothetical protein